MLAGGQTAFGQIAATIAEQRVLTGFHKGVTRVTRTMLGLILIMVPLVFLINGMRRDLRRSPDAWMSGHANDTLIVVAVIVMIVDTNLMRQILHFCSPRVDPSDALPTYIAQRKHKRFRSPSVPGRGAPRQAASHATRDADDGLPPASRPHEGRVHQMLDQEPGLQFVQADQIGYNQVVGSVVALLDRPRSRFVRID